MADVKLDMKRWLLVLVSFLVLAVIGCEATSNVPGGSIESDSQVDLYLGNWDWETTEYGTRYLVGTVKNQSDRTFGYVQISFVLLDANDVQVGSTMDLTNDLTPGRTWKFKAIVFDDDAVIASVSELTGY